MSQSFPFFWSANNRAVGSFFWPERIHLTCSDLLARIVSRFSTRTVDKHVHDPCVSASSLASTGLHHGWAVVQAIKCSGMALTIELQNLGDVQLSRDITAHIEHAFAGRGGNWRVSIAGSRASENWEMRIEGPNGFERSYTLAGSAGEHGPEVIRRLILQLMPGGSS